MYTTGPYTLDIYSDPDFVEGSADNVHEYKSVYLDGGAYRCTTVVGIRLFQNGELLTSAVIGASGVGTGIYDNSLVVDSDRVVICCSDSLFCLSVPRMELLWKTVVDTATCFEVFKYGDSYIVHGEMEISRLDKDGKILWQHSGADIFTTPEGKDVFRLSEEFIMATDWEYRTYKFDYDGNNHTDMSQFR